MDWLDQSAPDRSRCLALHFLLSTEADGAVVQIPLVSDRWKSILLSLPLSWAGVMYEWSSWRTLLPLLVGIAIFVVLGVYVGRV